VHRPYNGKMQERFLQANGIRIRYLDWEGSGQDLVLVHPTGFVADIWLPLAQRLCSRFHVVAPDVRGHGDTEKPADYTMALLVQDMAAFIDEAGLVDPIGVGHSAGATTIAALEAERSSTFRAAVLMEPVLNYDKKPESLGTELSDLAANTLKRRAIWPSRAAALDSYSSRPPFETWNETALREYVRHAFADQPDGTVELKCTPEAESRMYVNGPQTVDAGDVTPRVHCPVLLIRGQESLALSLSRFERTAKLMANCQSATIPGGHFAPFEQMQLAGDEIVRFLSEIEGGSGAIAGRNQESSD
jgi:pimeloyl-ACP methyl ester carboxylesterase